MKALTKQRTRELADKHFAGERCFCRVHWYSKPKDWDWSSYDKPGYSTCACYSPVDEPWLADQQNELIYIEIDDKGNYLVPDYGVD